MSDVFLYAILFTRSKFSLSLCADCPFLLLHNKNLNLFMGAGGWEVRPHVYQDIDYFLEECFILINNIWSCNCYYLTLKIKLSRLGLFNPIILWIPEIKWVALDIVISSVRKSGNNSPGCFKPMIMLETLRLIQTLSNIVRIFGTQKWRHRCT